MSHESSPETGIAIGHDFITESRNQLEASRKLIAHCVSQLDDGQIWAREHDDLNSIGNLLLHLAGNLTQRFASGIGGEPDRRDRPREFNERSAIPRDELMAGFESAVKVADAILGRLTAAQLNESRLYATLAGNDEISVMAVIFRTLVHLNGHAQEIVFMTRRLLGNSYRFQSPSGVPKRT
jgi:hypothetical protein